MKKDIVTQTANTIDIHARIAQFIGKLAGMEQNARAYSNAIVSEKRYLKKHYPAVRTYAKYLGLYRKALACSAVYHHSYEANRAKLIAKYPHLEGVLTTENVGDTLLLIKLHKQGIKGLAAGEYDALTRLKVACNAWYSMKLTREESALISQADNESVVQKKAVKVQVSLPIVMNAVKALLNAKSIYKQSIALALCSGRRPIELYKTGNFEAVDAHTVRFTGQAKNKGTGVRDNYIIPILFTTAAAFLKAFNEFRAKTVAAGYPDLTSVQVNNRLGSELSAITRDVLENNELSFYACRAIYTRRAVDTLKGAAVDTQIYIADILGHGAGDIKTALSYESIFITDKVVARENVKKEKILPLGVKNEVKVRRAAVKTDPRLAALEAFGANNQLSKSEAALHAWIVEHLQENPFTLLTQTYIAKRRSTSRALLARYLQTVADIIAL